MRAPACLPVPTARSPYGAFTVTQVSYVEPNGSWTGSLERDPWNRPLNKSSSGGRLSARVGTITTAASPISKRTSKPAREVHSQPNGLHLKASPQAHSRSTVWLSAKGGEPIVDSEKVKRLKAQLKKLEAAEKKAHAAYLNDRSRLEEALGAIGHESALGFIGYLEPTGANSTE